MTESTKARAEAYAENEIDLPDVPERTPWPRGMSQWVQDRDGQYLRDDEHVAVVKREARNAYLAGYTQGSRDTEALLKEAVEVIRYYTSRRFYYTDNRAREFLAKVEKDVPDR